jgi:hypothetical protein
MIENELQFKLWRRIRRYTPLVILLLAAFIFIRNTEKPISVHIAKRPFVFPSPYFSKKECSPDEKRIASHFSADTLPGLMRTGLIRGYRRNSSGSSISVNGKLWKNRSKYFKQSLLTEAFVFNKVNNYELSIKIIDDLSGILYAQISSSAETDFYDEHLD